MREIKSHYKHLAPPILALIILGAALPFAAGIIPVLNFTKERIEVYAGGGAVTVAGYYCYENPYPVPVIQGMRVPFPVDSAHPEPWHVTVERVDAPCDEVLGASQGRPVEEALGALTTADVAWSFTYSGDAKFSLALASNEKTVIKVVYTQDAMADNGSYILVTTQAWGRPLKEGVYRLYAYDVTSSNYPLASYGSGAWGFERADFMPGEDWHFAWGGGALARK